MFLFRSDESGHLTERVVLSKLKIARNKFTVILRPSYICHAAWTWIVSLMLESTEITFGLMEPDRH